MTAEMELVVKTFLRVGYTQLTSGYPESFTDYVDLVMSLNPNHIDEFRNGSRQLLEAKSEVLKELGLNIDKAVYDMIVHIYERTKLR